LEKRIRISYSKRKR